MLLDHVVDGLLTTMMMGSGCNLPPQPQHAHATQRTTKGDDQGQQGRLGGYV